MIGRLILILGIVLIIPLVSASHETKMGVQGRVLNITDNSTIETGILQINISDSNDCSGNIYTEDFDDPFEFGVYNVLLGQSKPLNLSYNEDYYLCLVIEGEQINITNFRGGQGQIESNDIDMSSFKDLFVPYSGATQSLNLGSNGLSVGGTAGFNGATTYSSSARYDGLLDINNGIDGAGLFKINGNINVSSPAFNEGFIWASKNITALDAICDSSGCLKDIHDMWAYGETGLEHIGDVYIGEDLQVVNRIQAKELILTENATADYFIGDGSLLTGISSGNIFDQNLNTTDSVEFENLTIENINLTNNLLSYTQRDVESSEFDLSGSGNIFTALTRCAYENTPPLCDFIDGVGGILNVTGSSNMGSLEMSHATNVYTQKINGFANLFGGYFSAGSSEVNGSGNIVWGTGVFKVSDNSYGNLIVGNNLEVTSGSEGSLVVGQLHKVTGKYCTAVGAQNNCYASYGSTIGYQNEVTSSAGTSTALGRGNKVNALFSGTLGYFNYQGGAQSYSFGRYVNETENFFVTIGNGIYGEPSRDIRISQGDAGNITINKETYFNTNLTAGNYFAGDGSQGITTQLNVSATCNITVTDGLITGFTGCT